MMTHDLFSYQPPAPPPRYPFAVGHRGIDTSIEAADKVAPSSRVLRERALEYVRKCGEVGATPDETARELGADILNLRPRFSELKAQGLIVDSGKRRENEKGNTQKVWISL